MKAKSGVVDVALIVTLFVASCLKQMSKSRDGQSSMNSYLCWANAPILMGTWEMGTLKVHFASSGFLSRGFMGKEGFDCLS